MTVNDIGIETANEVGKATGGFGINRRVERIAPRGTQHRIGAHGRRIALGSTGQNDDIVASGMKMIGKSTDLGFNSPHSRAEGVRDQNNAHAFILACLTGSAWVAIFG
ncbi:hypothetical protein HMPREF9061_01123 [Actinomyces sp. oral taxon 181 str. F0379]|nr:hypothetical protein HMPREF9061_01123 [Actinomyces sp. oral taxon 181 str. F0379]